MCLININIQLIFIWSWRSPYFLPSVVQINPSVNSVLFPMIRAQLQKLIPSYVIVNLVGKIMKDLYFFDMI